MVDLSGSNDPFQHGFSNSVFIVPAIVVVGLTGMLQCFSVYLINKKIFRLLFQVVEISIVLSHFAT